MPTFTPYQLWFRRIERLCIGDSVSAESYTITRLDNAIYAVQHGKRHYVEFEGLWFGRESVARAIDRVARYCLSSAHYQAQIRCRRRARTSVKPEFAIAT